MLWKVPGEVLAAQINNRGGFVGPLITSIYVETVPKPPCLSHSIEACYFLWPTHLAFGSSGLVPRPTQASWVRYLGSQVILNFKQGTRYLFETGDSTFRPLISPAEICRRQSWIDRLAGAKSSVGL